MDNNESILVFWDANKYGGKRLKESERFLQKNKVQLTTICYLVCEYILSDDSILDVEGYSPKARLEGLKSYYSEGSICFKPIIIPEKIIPSGCADNIQVVEEAITQFVSLELVKLNPQEIHIPLNSGTHTMRYAWISLYSKSALSRSLGDNVYLWQEVDDAGKKGRKKQDLYKLQISRNPFIDAIEKKNHTSKDISPINLDVDGKIRKSASIDVPMLLLGERGTGKSTVIESAIVPEKLELGFITDPNVQTIVCGQLSSELADDLLFGHMKGAYTGAAEEQPGAIEAAKNGILFLDEIQDLPQGTQRKLLRVLQEGKFSRLGQKTGYLTSNFRLICASNKSLKELQTRLDPDFFDRIATFKTFIKPLRKLDDKTLERLWENRWQAAVGKGFILPEEPDDFSVVRQHLVDSQMRGNIRDMEQLIAYIARDVYQGTLVISENVKNERYISALEEWLSDYRERYDALDSKEDENNKPVDTRATETIFNNHSWKDINNLFKKWLADTAIDYFGSRKEAAKGLQCEEKTLYNAKSSNDYST